MAYRLLHPTSTTTVLGDKPKTLTITMCKYQSVESQVSSSFSSLAPWHLWNNISNLWVLWPPITRTVFSSHVRNVWQYFYIILVNISEFQEAHYTLEMWTSYSPDQILVHQTTVYFANCSTVMEWLQVLWASLVS